MAKLSSNRLWGIGSICLAVLAILAALYTPEFLSRPTPSLLVLISSIAMTVICLILFVLGLVVIVKAAYQWQTADKKHSEHSHIDFDTAIPIHMLAIAEEIESLGFEKLGVKARGKKNGKQKRYWLWIDETRTVIAYLVEESPKKAYASFATNYLDGFRVETTFKWLMNVATDNILVHNFNSSITETYDFHMHLYGQQISQHGQPKIIESLSDTDIKDEANRDFAKQIYAAQIGSAIPGVFSYGAFVLAYILSIYLTSISMGLATISLFLTLGLFLLYMDK